MQKTANSIRAVFSVLCISTALALGCIATAAAHDIPSDVVVRSYLKVEPDRLVMLVRVPLESMRDVVLPLRGPGYLDIAAADEALRDAAIIWIANQVELYEGTARLEEYAIAGVRVSLPSDRSFRSYESALASFDAAALPGSTELVWQQALLDVWLDFPIGSADSEFSIRPRFERFALRTTTVLLFLAGDGAERPFEFVGDPGLVRLDPSWHYALFRFIALGFEHILDGVDHLLFILCLIVPIRRLRPLVVIVTSFTVAHSITLLSSALGFVPNALWFPPLIETLIAASIVYMALENIVAGNLQRRWMIAFGFGLVHGFGFAFALRETMQFAGSHLVTSLLAFNLGVEFGQLFVIVIVAPLIGLLFRYVMPERLGVIVLSALLAHSGWHWMSERASDLSLYSFQWPQGGTLVYLVMRSIAFLLIVGAILWLLARVYRRVLASERGNS